MANHLIKICGIKTAAMATLAVRLSANYIGIIFHEASPRHVEIDEATKIAHAVHLSGAVSVAVFVNQNACEMHAICEATNIKTVQLHGALSRREHHLLPADYQRFYVQSELQHDEDQGLSYLDKERDFVLIEHTKSFADLIFQWKQFRYHLPFRYFFAGGLSINNVQTAITLFNPDGVDVSSGVESSPGNKDITMIQQFINEVRSNDAVSNGSRGEVRG